MNREMGLSLRSWVSDIAILRISEGSSPLGRILTPHTSHEGNWCQASIALRHGTCCRLIPRQPSLVLFPLNINNLPMWALWSCGRRVSVVQAQRQIHRVLLATDTAAGETMRPGRASRR